jgi:hypothetical protein
LAASVDLKIIYGHSAPGRQRYDGAIRHLQLQLGACRHLYSIADIYWIADSKRSALPASLGEALAIDSNDGTRLLRRPCGSDREESHDCGRDDDRERCSSAHYLVSHQCAGKAVDCLLIGEATQPTRRCRSNAKW